jgi:hypothetical protein
MLKKISISLFLLIYFSASTVSFADEVVIEVLETVAPVAENGAEVVPMIDVIPALPEVILESEPIPEVIPSVEDVPVTNDVPTVESISDDVTPPEIENDTDILSEENTPLDSATEEL